MSVRFDAHRLDVERFASVGAELAGELALGSFKRLAPDLHQPDPAAKASWTAQGLLRATSDARVRPALRLCLAADLPLQCQRCLGQVLIPVRVDRYFIFAPDESTAARLDADCVDDVLVLNPEFHLPGLVEDELILALPLVPRHEHCTAQLAAPAATVEEAVSETVREYPFEALRGWPGTRRG